MTLVCQIASSPNNETSCTYRQQRFKRHWKRKQMESKMRVEHFTAVTSLPASNPVPSFPDRRWGTVLAADVVEYSRLTSLNEERTYLLYKSHRRELLDPKIAEYHARFVKSTGDGILAEFRSALNAVRCAVQIQQGMVERCRGISADRQIVFRIGLSCGNIIADPEDIYGHDVNVAARLQAVAPPGGIAMTDEVAKRVRSGLQLPLEDSGMQRFRNMCHPVHVFQLHVSPRQFADDVSR